MLLRDLKQTMLLPNSEIFINKIVKIKETTVQLISITSQEHRNVLWVMYKLPHHVSEGINPEEISDPTSNRAEMINHITQEIRFPNIYISEIMIQNQKMTFASSRANPLSYKNYEEYMRLQHFMENGLDIENWNEVDLDNIVIAAYEQMENEEFPTIDLSKKLDITLKVSRELKQVLINQPMTLEFSEVEKGTKIYFYDSIEKKNHLLYINKMEHYDLWKEANPPFEGEGMRDFSKAQIVQMKQEHKENLEKICPSGMNLAIIQYESENNVQLNFYSKEYLDERPVQRNSSTCMFFKSDKQLGTNGFKSRVCMIKPVEKDFEGTIAVELFSYFMEIPEEILSV